MKLRTMCRLVGFRSDRNMSIPIGCRALDNGTGPSCHKRIGNPGNMRCDPLAFSIEDHDAAKTRIFEGVRINVHLRERFKEGVLDVESRE